MVRAMQLQRVCVPLTALPVLALCALALWIWRSGGGLGLDGVGLGGGGNGKGQYISIQEPTMYEMGKFAQRHRHSGSGPYSVESLRERLVVRFMNPNFILQTRSMAKSFPFPVRPGSIRSHTNYSDVPDADVIAHNTRTILYPSPSPCGQG